MNKKKKLKIKKQLVFNCLSILFVFSIGFTYLGRLIYYKLDSEKETVYSQILSERLIEAETENIYQTNNHLVKLNGIYRYVGEVDNNYVKYKGYLWRVIKINTDNTVTMITEDSLLSLAYGEEENYVLSWLNSSSEKETGFFETSLEDTEHDLQENKLCLDTFSDVEMASCFETTTDYKIGLLSVYDYIEANANESYLNNGTQFWTSNRTDTSNSWFIATDGRLGTDSNSSKLGVRPVITISGSLMIEKGNGTLDNPYTIQEKSPTTLKDVYVGSYLTYQDTLWKVVSKETDKIKIVSEECIKEEDGECLTKTFSSYTNEIDLEEEDGLLTYLNGEYYESLDNKEFLTTGSFYTGSYSLLENDYRSCFEDSLELTVGLLSASEMFAYDLENTVLMTTSTNNDSSIFSINSLHSLYENIITEEFNIRPSLFMKTNITITEGEGTYISPYQLGGIES